MKKFISVGLVCVMLSLCTFCAFANSMTISTSTDEDVYELTYPADTQIPWEASEQALGAVTATKMLLSPGKTVVISVASANGFKLVNETDASKTIAYTLTGTDEMAFFPGDYGKSFPISANVAESEWRQAAAGEFTDILTFTAEYKDA